MALRNAASSMPRNVASSMSTIAGVLSVAACDVSDETGGVWLPFSSIIAIATPAARQRARPG